MNCWEYISNDRTDFVCLSSDCTLLIRKRPQVIPGGDAHPLHPPPGSAPEVTGRRSGHRPQARSQVRPLATGQVTGQITGHRSGHRPDHRSHTKTHTKLFLIDILLYKNRTSQGTSIIFFLFWTLPNPTHEKIYSCWSRKEDLRYSVTKVGKEITKVRKITLFVRKNESQNEGLLL